MKTEELREELETVRDLISLADELSELAHGVAKKCAAFEEAAAKYDRHKAYCDERF